MKLPFIPEAEYEIRTRLSPAAVCDILRENTGPEGAVLNRKRFTGTVGKRAFCIDEWSPTVRIPFKPTLWGTVCEAGEGSVVRVKLDLGPLVVVLYVILLIAAVAGIFINFALTFLLPFYLVLLNAGFAIGAETSRARLTELIEK